MINRLFLLLPCYFIVWRVTLDADAAVQRRGLIHSYDSCSVGHEAKINFQGHRAAALGTLADPVANFQLSPQLSN